MPATRIRPTRERLLAAGLVLARRDGLRALTVRAVAARAQVNLGSFVYHFGNREAFVVELVERWYAPLFQQLQLDADEPAPPLLALRHAVLHLMDWLVANRRFVGQLVLDAGVGERGVQQFLRSLDVRHPALLHGLVVRAQAAGALRRDDPWHQLMFVMSTLAMPVMLFHLAEPPWRAGAGPAADAGAAEHRCASHPHPPGLGPGRPGALTRTRRTAMHAWTSRWLAVLPLLVFGAAGVATLGGCTRGPDADLMSGYAEVDLVYVGAASAGTLRTVAVQRGDAVRQGQPLFALDPDAETLASAGAAARQQRAEAQAANLRKGRRPVEIRAIDAQLAQAQAALAGVHRAARPPAASGGTGFRLRPAPGRTGGRARPRRRPPARTAGTACAGAGGGAQRRGGRRGRRSAWRQRRHRAGALARRPAPAPGAARRAGVRRAVPRR